MSHFRSPVCKCCDNHFNKKDAEICDVCFSYACKTCFIPAILHKDILCSTYDLSIDNAAETNDDGELEAGICIGCVKSLSCIVCKLENGRLKTWCNTCSEIVCKDCSVKTSRAIFECWNCISEDNTFRKVVTQNASVREDMGWPPLVVTVEEPNKKRKAEEEPEKKTVVTPIEERDLDTTSHSLAYMLSIRADIYNIDNALWGACDVLHMHYCTKNNITGIKRDRLAVFAKKVDNHSKNYSSELCLSESELNQKFEDGQSLRELLSDWAVYEGFTVEEKKAPILSDMVTVLFHFKNPKEREGRPLEEKKAPAVVLAMEKIDPAKHSLACILNKEQELTDVICNLDCGFHVAYCDAYNIQGDDREKLKELTNTLVGNRHVDGDLTITYPVNSWSRNFKDGRTTKEVFIDWAKFEGFKVCDTHPVRYGYSQDVSVLFSKPKERRLVAEKTNDVADQKMEVVEDEKNEIPSDTLSRCGMCSYRSNETVYKLCTECKEKKKLPVEWKWQSNRFGDEVICMGSCKSEMSGHYLNEITQEIGCFDCIMDKTIKKPEPVKENEKEKDFNNWKHILHDKRTQCEECVCRVYRYYINQYTTKIRCEDCMAKRPKDPKSVKEKEKDEDFPIATYSLAYIMSKTDRTLGGPYSDSHLAYCDKFKVSEEKKKRLDYLTKFVSHGERISGSFTQLQLSLKLWGEKFADGQTVKSLMIDWAIYEGFTLDLSLPAGGIPATHIIKFDYSNPKKRGEGSRVSSRDLAGEIKHRGLDQVVMECCVYYCDARNVNQEVRATVSNYGKSFVDNWDKENYCSSIRYAPSEWTSRVIQGMTIKERLTEWATWNGFLVEFKLEERDSNYIGKESKEVMWIRCSALPNEPVVEEQKNKSSLAQELRDKGRNQIMSEFKGEPVQFHVSYCDAMKFKEQHVRDIMKNYTMKFIENWSEAHCRSTLSYTSFEWQRHVIRGMTLKERLIDWATWNGFLFDVEFDTVNGIPTGTESMTIRSPATEKVTEEKERTKTLAVILRNHSQKSTKDGIRYTLYMPNPHMKFCTEKKLGDLEIKELLEIASDVILNRKDTTCCTFVKQMDRFWNETYDNGKRKIDLALEWLEYEGFDHTVSTTLDLCGDPPVRMVHTILNLTY